MKKHILMLLMLIAALLLLGGALLVRSRVKTPAYETRLLSTPTSTARAASLPTSTHTPTPPETLTRTSNPTPTNIPTLKPRSGPPPRGQGYLSEIAEKGEALSRAAQELDQLLQAPQFTDPVWKRRVASEVAAIRAMHHDLMGMEVPVEMIGVHSALLDASFKCNEGMFFLRDVDSINSSDTRVASNLIMSCRAQFFRRISMLEENIEQLEGRGNH